MSFLAFPWIPNRHYRFVDTLMRFGMDILLTPEEEELVAPIVKPCYAALGLANDYFSSDIEWEEFQSSESSQTAMTNAVWLFMQWHQVGKEEAKRLVRQVTNDYEREYQQRVQEYIAGEGKSNSKIQLYLTALGYQIPGNVTWSLRCPRYHPWLCEEGSALLQTSMEEARDLPNVGKRRSVSEVSLSSESSVWSGTSDRSARSSVSSAPSLDDREKERDRVTLGTEVSALSNITCYQSKVPDSLRSISLLQQSISPHSPPKEFARLSSTR